MDISILSPIILHNRRLIACIVEEVQTVAAAAKGGVAVESLFPWMIPDFCRFPLNLI